MVVTKPTEIRSNQKEYFNMAYQGETIVVSRPRNENVVVISENEYQRMESVNRILTYYYKLKESGALEKDTILMDAVNQTIHHLDSPFHSLSEAEFFRRIERSLKQISEGKVQDADEALDEICAELEYGSI